MITTDTALRPDLSEAEALSLIALRRLTWQPPRVTRIGMETRRGHWHDAHGARVPVDSQTHAWIGFWQTRGLLNSADRVVAELSTSGWRAYRRLLGRGLTPLEQFHERWSRCPDDDADDAFSAAAAYADHCVGPLTAAEGEHAARWLEHAEHSLSAIDAVRASRAVDLDALTTIEETEQ